MANEFLSKIPKWVFTQQELVEEHKRVVKEVIGDKHKHFDDEEREMLEIFFNQWFIFDRIGKSKKTPFDSFIERNSLLFSEEEKEVYKKFWSEMIFGIFKVISVRPGESMEIKDLVSGKMYFVKEHLGTLQIKPGIILIGRLFPFKDHWLFGSATKWSEPYEIERAIKHFHESFKKKPIDALGIIQTLFLRPRKNLDDLKTCEEEIKKWIKRHRIKISLEEIKNKILKEKELAYPSLLQKIIDSIPSISNEKINEITDLFVHFYNLLPQKELGGLSPEEKDAPVGRKEKMLLADFFQSASPKINPDTYPDKNEAKKAMEKFWEEWLKTPQEELGGKTPEEVIIDERKKLGRKNLEISYKLELTELHKPGKEEIKINKDIKKAGKLIRKNRPEEALKIYEKLFPMLKDSPESFRIYGNLGLCYILTGSKEKGVEYLKKALEINPDYEIAKNNLFVYEELSLEDVKKLKISTEEFWEDKLRKFERLNSEEICKKIKEIIPEFDLEKFRLEIENYVFLKELFEDKYCSESISGNLLLQILLQIYLEVLWKRISPKQPPAETILRKNLIKKKMGMK